MPRIYTKIVLIGFRNSGKTTVGKILARKLKWKFIDLDAHIFKLTGKPIQVITKYGRDWHSFRHHESRALVQALKLNQVVISAGGGLLVNDTLHKKSGIPFGELQRRLVKNSPGVIIILLTASERILKKRLFASKSKADASLLVASHLYSKKHRTREAKLSAIIRGTLPERRARRPLYKKAADITVPTSDLQPNQIVQRILKKLVHEPSPD